MNKERREAVIAEAKRRLDLWLSVVTFDEMTVQGSLIRFKMAIGLIGYPFKKEDWMVDTDFSAFISDEEFYSEEYDEIMYNLFESTRRECANN
jgi:hypothetical protein